MNCKCGKVIWAKDHVLTPACGQLMCDDCGHFRSHGKKDSCALNGEREVHWYTSVCSQFSGRG